MGRVSNAKQKLMDAGRYLIWQHGYSATTIDAICAKAEVKKGSFYYFFSSKSDLIVEALRTDWEDKKPGFDDTFSGPPLERLNKFFKFVYEAQSKLKNRHGRVLGCPLFSLGCEVSMSDPEICSVVQGILRQYEGYIEEAIRDAHSEGSIQAPDSAAKAQCVFSYFEGALTNARIQNDAELLKDLYPTTLDILDVQMPRAALDENDKNFYVIQESNAKEEKGINR